MISLKLLLVFGVFISANAQNVYKERFLEHWNKMHDPKNGYFSSHGVPYHAVETIVVESSDYGHETTSEALSYFVWLEAMYGGITGNFSQFNHAYDILEKYMIPAHESQPNIELYNPKSPGGYSPVGEYVEDYPLKAVPPAPVGVDPLHEELVKTYNSTDIYLMHWLLDVDNAYGFGNSNGNCQLGPDDKNPSFLNTYTRGPRESAWKTIPQSTCDDFKYGSKQGFGGLFQEGNLVPSWKFSVAPDAEARTIQGAFWASTWAKAAGKLDEIKPTLAKVSKLGDYLRYCFYDKIFKKIGNCIDPYKCAAGTGKDSAHYLLGWYVGWGGSLSKEGGYSWRISDGVAHFGYQNPMAAYALVTDPNLKPKSPTAVDDWMKSLQRQLELYEYLQSKEGAFAGGVTNSWNERYEAPPKDIQESTFHGMWYSWAPVAYDPPSNEWYGMQPWSTDRLAQYYYVTGDTKVKAILDKWASWIIRTTKFDGDNFMMPAGLDWEGVPPEVHCRIKYYGNSIGPAAATARALTYYAGKSGNKDAKNLAKKLLDSMWKLYKDDKGVTIEEQPTLNFNQSVYVPDGWTGVYPHGEKIDKQSTFVSMRSFYKKDPEWSRIEDYMKGGPPPKFHYHRFWDQTDVALALGAYSMVFNE